MLDHSHRRFTLIEMLVVIAIIATLAAMLSPSLQTALRSAKGVACLNNLRMISTATTMYTADNNGWIFNVGFNEGGGKFDIWSEALGQATNNPDHAVYIDNRDTFVCPGSTLSGHYFDRWQIYGMYRANGDPNSQNKNWHYVHYTHSACIFYRLQAVRQPSGLILYADTRTGGNSNPAYAGRPLWYFRPDVPLDDNAGVNTLHVGERANVVFFDGHLESLNPAGLLDRPLSPVKFQVNSAGAYAYF